MNQLCNKGALAETAKNGRPDRGGERHHQPQHRRGARRGRHQVRCIGERQHQRSAKQHDAMHACLPAAAAAGQRMRIDISRQQNELEEHHDGVPHRRRAAQQRQQRLADQRLRPEQQKGADE
ncbi:MAG: hypothetical protein WDN04_01845 [Rhodospirillales bacterium]